MPVNARKTRAAPTTHVSNKRRKLSTNKGSSTNANGIKKSLKAKGKDKAMDRGIIPVPTHEDEDVELSDQDIETLNELGNAVSFLGAMDHTAIMRSEKETERLHRLDKSARKKPSYDDELPSINSHSDDGEESWSSGIEGYDSTSEDEGEQLSSVPHEFTDSDIEMPYETLPRKRHESWNDAKQREVKRLPIKLANGQIKALGSKPVGSENVNSSDDEESVEDAQQLVSTQSPNGNSFGARFGRLAVHDIIGMKSRKQRVEQAKAQIASICQDILADPENSLGLLKRLHAFSLKKIPSHVESNPIPNDPIIRKLAILSQLAIFKDIIPGYRIRTLTEKEKAEKVSQAVAHTRDWEQGLVSTYQTYLQALESELKIRSELSQIAISCMCTLLVEATHFNFRINLMTCIVSHLSRKSWNQTSELCLDALIKVFKADLTGVASLEIVRLLNKMIKDRHFKIHPNVLSCLLHLRLRTELSVRASDSAVDKDNPQIRRRNKSNNKRGKFIDPPHLSKKAKKAQKETKEIEKEMREAEAEVDKEERTVTQTETLKLLFSLYFRILKNPMPTRLLPTALSGVSKFSHLVNIDFFKDLLNVLKGLMETPETEEHEEDSRQSLLNGADTISRQLLCIMTAFDLLSGQGEALNIDLTQFIAKLYSIILPLTMMQDLETRRLPYPVPGLQTGQMPSLADLLFRALGAALLPRSPGITPPWRSAAFVKRLLIASLHWTPTVVLRVLDLVETIFAKDYKLVALLSTDDRVYDGIYRPDVDDLQLCHPFGSCLYELRALQDFHWDPRVCEKSRQLFNFTAQ